MTYPLYMLGRWDEALAMIEDPTEEQTRSGGVLLSLMTSILEIHLHRGDVHEARRIFSLFAHLEGSTDMQDRSCYFGARAELQLADGRFEDAAADAEAAIEAARVLGYAQQAAKQAVVCAFEAALTLGDDAKARGLIASIEEVPPGRRAPFLDAQANRFRARLDGEGEGYAAAAETFREHGLRFWLAVTQLEHGEWLVQEGRSSDAEPLLAEARETFEELKATPWLERLDLAAPVGVRAEATL